MKRLAITACSDGPVNGGRPASTWYSTQPSAYTPRGRGRVAGRLLGAHVRGRAEHGAGPGHQRVLGLEPRDAEVGEQHAAVLRDEHVRRLDVAVDDAGLVRGGECVGEQRAHARRDLGEHRAAPLELAEQRLAADQLHHDERRIVAVVAVAADVVDAQDVRVLERGRGARLALESPHDLRPPREVREQHLDRDLAAQLAVARAEHRRHAALAELAIEAIVRGQGVGECSGGGHRGIVQAGRAEASTRKVRGAAAGLPAVPSGGRGGRHPSRGVRRGRGSNYWRVRGLALG